jgi:hypothetical protein
MGQTTYNALMTNGSAGLLADSGFKNVLSPRCAEEMPVGLGVVKVAGVDYQVRLPHQNLSTITFDADLVTSNVINGDIGGNSIAPVTFASTHLDTMNAIAAAIELLDGVASATVGGSGNRVITVVAEEDATNVFAENWVVTLGASQAGVTESNTSSDSLYGIALRTQNKENLRDSSGSNGPAPYYVGDCVSMLTRGRVFVTVEDTLDSDDDVYVRFYPSSPNLQLGSFRSDSDSGTALQCADCVWRVGASAGALAVLEINKPN